MKKMITLLFACFSIATAFSQAIQEHDAFKKEAELKNAFLKFDMSSFAQDHVTFVCDTIEKDVKVGELNALMKDYIRIPRNTLVKKASETNNGWIQTFGIYKGDDALMYVRFTMDPISGKLSEVNVEKNN